MTSRIVRLGLAAVMLAISVGPAPARDAREALRLSQADQEKMLAGMRRYLQSVEGVVEGLAKNDMKAVAKTAGRAGMSMLSEVSFETALSVPVDFGLKSMETHQLFDLLAEETREPGTKAAVTQRLGQILATCNGCHASYRLAKR